MKGVLLFLAIIGSQLTLAQDNMGELLNKYNDHSVSYITSMELYSSSAKGKEYVILDAREPNEYNTSHIPEAIYVGNNNFNPKQITALNLEKDAAIVVYCTVGVRSEDIGEKLKELGYTHVYNLFGGIISWKNNDLDVIDNTETTTQNVHVYSKKWGKWLTKGTAIYD